MPRREPVAGPAARSRAPLSRAASRIWCFDYDKSEIKPEGRQVLQRQADWLKKYSNVTVTVEGHCDERGTREYNLALGERRATAVKKMLVALGVTPNRVSTISYGKERPAVPGSTEAAWAQNRRGVTVVN
jgi:peptidoglycan-associated lipoprotein